MKRLFCFVLALVLALSLCACGSKAEDTATDTTTTTVGDTTTAGDDATTTVTGNVEEDTTTDGTSDGDTTAADTTVTEGEGTSATEGATTGGDTTATNGTVTNSTATKGTTAKGESTKAPTKTQGGNTTQTPTTAGKTEGNKTETHKPSATKTTGNKTEGNKPSATKPSGNKTTATSNQTEEGPAIRILAIGDHAAANSMERYLYEMFKSAGYKTIRLGILYADKSTIDTHYAAIKNNSKSYEFRINDNGIWKKHVNTAASTAFLASEWDYVVLQQGTADAGIPATYSKLGDLLKLIKKQCSAEIYWNMPWAYSRGCTADGFKNYKNNERNMYETIVSTTLKHVMGQNDISRLIPTGTTIQNLRTTALRDTLTTDGVRLNVEAAAYAAAMTWYAVLTDDSAANLAYRPTAIKKGFTTLAEAVDNAVNMPQQVTSATEEVKDLKILSIGHSFSLDAMRTYMWDLFDAAGYNVTIGYLYYPSCSLEQHWHYISDNSPSYEQYGKNSDGDWVTQHNNVTALTALWDEDWDIVTFQPDPDLGHGNISHYCKWGCNKNVSSDYLHFDQLVDKVAEILADPKNPNGSNTDVKFYYHLTWTWRKDCYLYSISGYNQATLYPAFIDATKNKVLTNKNILGVIPCNTAIENARTTWMGDTFNAEGSNDGYHLNDKGDLVAAMTWVSYFTGMDANAIYVDSTYTDRQVAAIAEAVNNAIQSPWSVTESTYKTEK